MLPIKESPTSHVALVTRICSMTQFFEKKPPGDMHFHAQECSPLRDLPTGRTAQPLGAQTQPTRAGVLSPARFAHRARAAQPLSAQAQQSLVDSKLHQILHLHPLIVPQTKAVTLGAHRHQQTRSKIGTNPSLRVRMQAPHLFYTGDGLLTRQKMRGLHNMTQVMTQAVGPKMTFGFESSET
jgi:hypothetical protein